MLLRPRLRSLLALVALAGFFTAGASEARAVQPCPHHDGVPSADHGGGRTQAAATADHGHHGTLDAQDARDASDAEHGPCVCIVCCESGIQQHSAAPTALVVAFFAAPTAFVSHVRDQLPPAPSSVRWRPDLPNAPPFVA
jgi:hypothetical protein